jgi:DNA-binding NarL/FixJ family response regulator
MRLVMAKGAAGFVSKAGKSQELLAILRLVLDGEVVVPSDLQTAAGMPSLERSNTGFTPLPFSARQTEVLYLLLDGNSNRQISEALHLSEETIKSHVAAILRGFGVNSRVQAVLAAARHGYTMPPP